MNALESITNPQIRININLQAQYEGYFYTPLLWHGILMGGLKSFEFKNNALKSLNASIPERLRLGKRVEHFALCNLSQQSQFEIIAHNVQIQRENVTLGELDCLLKMATQTIHLEIVYKFYLYVPEENEGLKAWIGPNKKDSLIEKLNRLKNHQLPLLYQPECISFLKSKQINAEDVAQRVLFKAQLFVPEHLVDINFEGLNEACITGFYIHYSKFKDFNHCKFFIPSKDEWLLVPHASVGWLSYVMAIEKIEQFVNQQYSPMIWIKHPNGLIQKYFITWWI